MGEKRDKFLKVVKLSDNNLSLEIDYKLANMEKILSDAKEKLIERELAKKMRVDIANTEENACSPTLENNCKTTEDN